MIFWKATAFGGSSVAVKLQKDDLESSSKHVFWVALFHLTLYAKSSQKDMQKRTQVLGSKVFVHASKQLA